MADRRPEPDPPKSRPNRKPQRKPKPRPAEAKPGRVAPRGVKPPAGWQAVAGWYDKLVGDEGSEYHRHVVLPGVLRLLGDVAGKRMIDIACGQGVLCRQLAGRGAEVTGVDAAPDLIRAARDRDRDRDREREREREAGGTEGGEPAGGGTEGDGPEGGGTEGGGTEGGGPDGSRPPGRARYLVGDALSLRGLPDGAFEMATIVLAIQNMHPLRPAFEAAARVLVPGGRLVVVMMHPCFRGAKQTRWGWDEADQTRYRRVDRYLLPRKSPIVTHPGSDPGTYTWDYHRPIEAYIKAARQAGLLLDALEEWPSHKTSEPGPKAKAENTAREEIPLFMAMRFLGGLTESAV